MPINNVHFIKLRLKKRDFLAFQKIAVLATIQFSMELNF